jgi:N-acetylglutamate synthase-like GNAT family acetyltransferase
MSIILRSATEKDWTAIKELLVAVDIYYTALTNEAFLVAEDNHQIVGVVQFKEYPNYYFLSSLAIKPARQGQGIGSQIIKQLSTKTNKPIYLYTISPNLFKRFGFQETTFADLLPSREHYECADCHADRCVCLVRFSGAA